MEGGAGFEPFFLPADPGARFALFHYARGPVRRGKVLYVHPFAEEMNKSRRMAAQQARAFAAAGYAVLQIDLYGCGDSNGDFVDARWEIWKRDLQYAATWLAERCPGPLHLWGLRLGATLALDFWRDQPDRFISALLWQPVLNGETFMNQFLRFAVAGDALRDAGSKVTTEWLRQRLDNGETVEVAGYALSSSLAAAIDRQRLAEWSLAGAPLHWLEVRSSAVDEPPQAARRLLADWQVKGVQASYDAVPGDPFWTTVEIAAAPALITASTAHYAAAPS